METQKGRAEGPISRQVQEAQTFPMKGILLSPFFVFVQTVIFRAHAPVFFSFGVEP